jgi:hypothetical protein
MILRLGSQGIRGIIENPWIIIVIIVGAIGWIILKEWLKKNGKWD